MEKEHDKQPEIPDDIAKLIEDIHEREQQRQKAVDIMLEKVLSSTSDDERALWSERLWHFTRISEEFKQELYPEIFKDDKY